MDKLTSLKMRMSSYGYSYDRENSMSINYPVHIFYRAGLQDTFSVVKFSTVETHNWTVKMCIKKIMNNCYTIGKNANLI